MIKYISISQAMVMVNTLYDSYNNIEDYSKHLLGTLTIFQPYSLFYA